ncbi:MAG: hypothetical protein JXR56_03900 [Candidatus Cloacimonetes bacterium]|nr:hypothetical protein [Candidatus Cloacimonadota bacterium]
MHRWTGSIDDAEKFLKILKWHVGSILFYNIPVLFENPKKANPRFEAGAENA